MLPLVLGYALASQAPDDLVLCTAASDCPVGAVCEDGVCVMAAEEPVERPRERRVRRRRRRRPRRQLLEGECRRHYDCPVGQECFKRRCGPPIPSRGTGYLIGGGIATGLGALFAVAAPLCKIDSPGRTNQEENVCLTVDLGLAVLGLGAGIPLLVVGISKRSEYRKWVKEHHPRFAISLQEAHRFATIGFDF